MSFPTEESIETTVQCGMRTRSTTVYFFPTLLLFGTTLALRSFCNPSLTSILSPTRFFLFLHLPCPMASPHCNHQLADKTQLMSRYAWIKYSHCFVEKQDAHSLQILVPFLRSFLPPLPLRARLWWCAGTCRQPNLSCEGKQGRSGQGVDARWSRRQLCFAVCQGKRCPFRLSLSLSYLLSSPRPRSFCSE